MLSSTFSKILLVGVMALAALLVPGILAGSTAYADPDPTCDLPTDNESNTAHCVHTAAVVKPGVAAPRVLNTFELPDMDPNTSGMQYIDPSTKGPTEANHRHDDGPTAKSPRQMRVLPWADDKPKRGIEVFALVSSDIGVGDIIEVTAWVYDPTQNKDTAPHIYKDTFKLTRRTFKPDSNNPALQNCDYLGSPTNQQGPLHAAIWTGQIARDKGLTDPVDINAAAADHYHQCTKNALQVWSGVFYLNKSQPEGKYQVVVQARGNLGGKGPIHQESFEVLNLVAFKLDFDRVNFANIVPGQPKVITGNNVFGPFPSTTPTIEVTGNSALCVQLTWSDMVGKQTNPARISSFNAQLNGENIAFTGGVKGRPFSNPIAPNDPKQIDFTVKPPTQLPVDTYWGTIHFDVFKPNTPCLRAE